ncbi:MAG TPA: hypothetical protein VGF45_19855 [Polyangia bacterium]
MPISAIVLRPTSPAFAPVSSYYAAAPQEPTKRGALAVSQVADFGSSFHGLLDAIIAWKRAYIVVVSHGSAESGLNLPVAAATKVVIGSAIDLLLSVVDSISDDGKTANAEALRAAANDSALPEATVLKIAQKCWKIRWANDLAFQVHIRGCDIGADRRHLRKIQRLFRSLVVSAPNCPMLYTNVNPLGSGRGPVSDVVAWGNKNRPVGRRFIYTRPSGPGPLLLDLEYLGTKAASQAAVQATADVRKWAQIFHDNLSTPSTNSFPVAALYPHDSDTYFLPHEPGYAERIVTVEST